MTLLNVEHNSTYHIKWYVISAILLLILLVLVLTNTIILNVFETDDKIYHIDLAFVVFASMVIAYCRGLYLHLGRRQ